MRKKGTMAIRLEKVRLRIRQNTTHPSFLQRHPRHQLLLQAAAGYQRGAHVTFICLCTSFLASWQLWVFADISNMASARCFMIAWQISFFRFRSSLIAKSAVPNYGVTPSIGLASRNTWWHLYKWPSNLLVNWVSQSVHHTFIKIEVLWKF